MDCGSNRYLRAVTTRKNESRIWTHSSAYPALSIHFALAEESGKRLVRDQEQWHSKRRNEATLRKIEGELAKYPSWITKHWSNHSDRKTGDFWAPLGIKHSVRLRSCEVIDLVLGLRSIARANSPDSGWICNTLDDLCARL
jgi:hypothetical protein